jgi:hypothetical protein
MNRAVRGPLGATFLATFACIAGLACGFQDVVIAEYDGGPPIPVGKMCAVSDDCGPLGYCMKSVCNAPMGVCDKVPSFCSDQVDRPPPCGCSGKVIYWNDCLRQQAREPAAQSCAQAPPTPCQGPGACPPGASCRQGPTACSAPTGALQGECWVLPEHCPTDLSFFSSCGPPADGGCVDFCSAIRTEQPFEFPQRCSSFSGGPMGPGGPTGPMMH